MAQTQIMEDKYILGQSNSMSITTGGQEIQMNMQLATRNYAPNFSAFELYYGQNYYLGSYIASQGTLSNGASINSTTGYVTSLGGGNNGSVIISVSVAKSGTYYLAIKYLSSASVILTLSINGQGSPIQLALESTTTMNVSDAKTRYYPVTLNAGTNTIKLYNYFSLSTADIGKIDVMQDPYSPIYTISNATLGGGALVYPSTGFILGLGGNSGGTATFSINCPVNAIYVLDVLYTNTSGSSLLLKVSIDGGYPISQYFNVTPNNYASDAISQQVYLGLVMAGNHTIKFYNDTGQPAPLVGNVTIKLTPSNMNILANTGILSSGANIIPGSSYVGGIGGLNNGTLTISINAPEVGVYSLGIQYVNDSTMNSNMAISVNGGDKINYIFPKTLDSSPSSASIFYTNVTLNVGNNSILFSSTVYSTDENPRINNIYFQKVLIHIPYQLTNSNITLQNGAAIQNGLIKNIGTNLGYIILTYPGLALAGSYTFAMTYVATINNRVCTIDVNGINTGTTYSFITTNSMNLIDAKTQTVNLNLPSGNNTLKIYTV